MLYINNIDRYLINVTRLLQPGVKPRRDAIQKGILRSWLEREVLPEFSGRTLPIDTAVAQRCARLHVPDKRGERDTLIAALAHDMGAVTHRVVDFRPTGVTIVNPWEPMP